MAFAFDTLGYAKHLREAGVDPTLAEAHAEAASKFIMTELVTKADLESVVERLTLRMTVICGGMIFAVVGVGIAALRFLR